MARKTQFQVQHTPKPPELVQLEWFTRNTGIGVAIVLSIIVGLIAVMTLFENNPSPQFEEVVRHGIVASLVVNLLSLFYIIPALRIASKRSDHITNYLQPSWKVAREVLLTPWVISVLVTAVYVLLAIIIALVLLYIFWSVFAKGG